MTRAIRHARILHALTHQVVNSLGQLAEILVAEGIVVNQTTLSRDFQELGVVRHRTENGSWIYTPPGEGGTRIPRQQTGCAEPTDTRLAHLAVDLLLSAEASSNLVLIRTPPGAAQYLASAIDHAEWPSILGTVAGDDTILVIACDPAGGEKLAARFLRLLS
ncbi:MAG TPA: arginine repressor [Trebonia sp.]|nr:arginine repressor [Trebonia sp.]